jgi:undecaprenyl diphosphate synthase
MSPFTSLSAINVHHTGHSVNGEYLRLIEETQQLNPTKCPKHVAFICDGNVRWAQQRNQSVIFGHRQGAQRLIDTLPVLREHGVECCTMFAFSTENWNRSPQEVSSVFRVMEQTAHDFYDKACREQIHIQVLGNLDDERIPKSLVKALGRLQEGTLATSSLADSEHLTNRFTLNLAINYGGRKDLVQAAQQLARQVQLGLLQPDDITEDHLTSSLSTRHLADPDLIIRTSGEYRLSNFLLWNAAYAELYFTDCLWPDFDREELRAALEWYAERQRRFGGRNNMPVER